MNYEESREHHFVPQFLLRSWAVNGVLMGYWWDSRRSALVCKRKGPRAFGWQLGLLTLRAHKLGRDALERIFFGEVDTKGAYACSLLIKYGPSALNEDQRCDFARLLLSLEIRRPPIVATLRDSGRRHIAEALDSDPEILEAMALKNLAILPSKFVEGNLGVSLEDYALGTIQQLVDNPHIGTKLINALWHIVRLGPDDGSLLLADRPLIRLHAYDAPGATWMLPLNPKTAFVAVNHLENLRRIKNASPYRFAKKINVLSARQTERFVFCADAQHERWIGKHLSDPLRNTRDSRNISSLKAAHPLPRS
ncbi:MAG TPA: DUF4238 domain-containing protein [Alphaproteobacteria bacterium]|nr:DUF4238 domain-containing protein [Alphaproteobacteria bacterium]